MTYVALYFLIGIMMTAYLSNNRDEDDQILPAAQVMGVFIWPVTVAAWVYHFVKAYLEDRE